MDFDLPSELVMLKETVSRFVNDELIPIEMESMDGPDLKPDVRLRLERKAKDLGLWLLDVPEEYGGQGLSLLGMAAVWVIYLKPLGAHLRQRKEGITKDLAAAEEARQEAVKLRAAACPETEPAGSNNWPGQ